MKELTSLFYVILRWIHAPTLTEHAEDAEAMVKLNSLEKLNSLGKLNSLEKLNSLGKLNSLEKLNSLGKLNSLEKLNSLGKLNSLEKLNSLGKLNSLEKLKPLRSTAGHPRGWSFCAEEAEVTVHLEKAKKDFLKGKLNLLRHTVKPDHPRG